jgi:hypothetical protein
VGVGRWLLVLVWLVERRFEKTYVHDPGQGWGRKRQEGPGSKMAELHVWTEASRVDLK